MNTLSPAQIASAKRSIRIDTLRAIALLSIFATHTLADHLGTAAINWTWNALHFAVVPIVICSGYVTAITYKEISTVKSVCIWYGKRIIRLYAPYAIYCTVLFTVLSIFYRIGITHENTPSYFYVLSSFFTTGGLDVGWFPLLFIQLAIATPIYMYILQERKRTLLTIFVLITISLFEILFPIAPSYSRTFAWIPWSLIFLLGSGYYYAEKRGLISTRTLFFLACIFFLSYLGLSQLLIKHAIPLTLTVHKYPPDFFYFSYGLAFGALFFGIYPVLEPFVTFFKPVITFVSRHSYGMFFIHLFILWIFRTFLPNISVTAEVILSITVTIVPVLIFEVFLKGLARADRLF